MLNGLKLRDSHIKNLPVDKKIRALYCGFTKNTKIVIGKNVVHFLSPLDTREIILGNDSLPQIGIEIPQKQLLLPVNIVSIPDLFESNVHSNTLFNMYNHFKAFFNRLGKVSMDRVITHFHFPFKSIHTKSRRVLLHLLESVKSELNSMEKDGHILKFHKCDEECFISPIAITRKKMAVIN